MKKITFEPPDSKAEGYLRRLQTILEIEPVIAEKGIEGMDKDMFNDMILFLLQYVKEPTDREKAKEALLDVSQEQFMGLLHLIANPVEGESV